jgi:hypothetical protein
MLENSVVDWWFLSSTEFVSSEGRTKNCPLSYASCDTGSFMYTAPPIQRNRETFTKWCTVKDTFVYGNYYMATEEQTD